MLLYFPLETNKLLYSKISHYKQGYLATTGQEELVFFIYYCWM